MKDPITPAIVIPCFKRVDALQNLCNSLLRANYPEGTPVPLVFSIDHSGNDRVADFAGQFDWPFGEKRIIRHPENIGLRKNILYCGDLTSTYGAVIILEDDLFVSRTFYRYAREAVRFYESCEQVSGISLYAYSLNELVNLPFQPITEDSDVHFIRFPSSWGQAWTSGQWNRFKAFYQASPDLNKTRLPAQVKSWSAASWKKYFCAFLMESDTWVVYPNQSQSTNFSDFEGTHHYKGSGIYQTPIQNKTQWHFKMPEQQQYKYDAFFEVLPDSLPWDDIRADEITIDLYGSKLLSYGLEGLNKKYLLTKTRYIKGIPLKTFGMKIKPLENNLVYQIKGKDIGLFEVGKIRLAAASPLHDYENDFYTPFITLPNLLRTSTRKVLEKIKNFIHL